MPNMGENQFQLREFPRSGSKAENVKKSESQLLQWSVHVRLNESNKLECVAVEVEALHLQFIL